MTFLSTPTWAHVLLQKEKDKMVLPLMRPEGSSGFRVYMACRYPPNLFPCTHPGHPPTTTTCWWGGFRTLGDMKWPNSICTVNKTLGVTSDVKLQWKFFFYCLHLSNKLFKNYVVSFFLKHFACGWYIFPNTVCLLKWCNRGCGHLCKCWEIIFSKQVGLHSC